MIKITGLDAFQRQLKEASDAIAALDGDITSVKFDPNDPASIEAAIQEMETAIDSRVGNYRDNGMVASLVEQTKEHFRRAILDKAAESRESGDKE